jgi:hypothetical protein
MSTISLRLRSFASVRSLRPAGLRFMLVYLFYLAIAIVITWPLVTVLSTEFAGLPDSDAYEMGRHIWWYNHALRTGQPVFFQPLLGYPDGIEGGVLLWSDPLQFFPAWLFAFFMSVPAAFNLSALLTMALNGWAMYWLAWHLTGQKLAPALLAGVVFMAAPTFQGHLAGGHGGLMVMWPVPLYIYALYRLRDRTDKRWIALGALFFFLSPGGHILQTIYVLMPITALFALARLVRREWAWLARVLVTAALGSIVLVVYLLPVASATLTTQAYTAEGGCVRYSADLLAIVTPSFAHPVFVNLEYTHRVLGINIVEGFSYIGVVAGALAIIAVWKERAARWWLVLAVVVWILSLGPLLKVFDAPVTLSTDSYETHITLPWAALQNLPLFNLARSPARFNFVLALAVAMMVGYGAARLWMWLDSARTHSRASLQWVILLVAMVVILWEYQAFLRFPTAPSAIPEAVTALAERDDIRAVFDVPWDNLLSAKEALYLQTGHQQALIAGQMTRRTPVSPAKLWLLQSTLDPALLDEAGVDIILLHKTFDYDGSVEEFTREQLGEPFYEDERIALFEAPDTDDVPVFTTLVTPLTTIDSRAESYIYAPKPGWVRLTGEFQGDGRSVELTLDGERVQTWTVEGNVPFDVSVPLREAGYHTIVLEVEPSCPQNFNEALECRSVVLNDLELGEFTPDEFDVPVVFEHGIQLGGAYTLQDEESVSIWLWWDFEQARSDQDVRFVHIVDESGNLIAQADNTLGIRPAESEWVETVTIALPADLSAGTYRVYTGWYTYPDTTPFPIIGDGGGRALVGEFTKSS